MSTRDSTAAKHIVGLFTELLGVGGVQEAGSLTAAAITDIAGRRALHTDFLSLNDPPHSEPFRVGSAEVRFHGFNREKLKFVASALRAGLLDRPAIILAAHPNLAPPAACMKTLAPKAQLVVMSHGVDVWQPLPALRRRALRVADIALAPSRDTAEKLAAVQGLSPERIRVLPWPISPSFLELVGRADVLLLPPSFPCGASDRVILTVGRWMASERYKGADELIRAVAQLYPAFPGLHLVAVGGGDDLPRLRTLASELGVAERTHFLEDLHRGAVAACYSHAEIFALPSAGEGFGLVYLEAMAFAKPVVGASCGGTLDVIQDGINGLLVPPRHSDALARALARLLQNESMRQSLGARGGEIVRQKYSFAAFESALEYILWVR